MTGIMQRKCKTCTTINDEKELFCGKCGGILGKSTLIEGTIEPQLSTPSSSNQPEKEISDSIVTTKLRPIVPVSDTPTGATSVTPIGIPPSLPSPMASGNSAPLLLNPLPNPITFGNSASPPLNPQPGGNKRWFDSVFVLIIAILVVIAGGGGLIYHISHPSQTPTPTATPVLPQLPNTLGVRKFPDGQYVGINDGSSPPFDVYAKRSDSNDVKKAATDLSQGNRAQARIDLSNALGMDTNDAEASIYLENINAVDFGNYVSLVVAVDFDPKDSDLSAQSILQGAYTEQKKFNDQLHPVVKIRLLIANTARDNSYDLPVAKQIVSIAQKEHVVGVLGWPNSTSCHEVISTLAVHSIPLLSPTATADDLTTNGSKYFFRVVPPNTVQAQTSADFAVASKGLHAKNAVVFFDPNDSYSLSIAGDFETDFTKNGGTILPEKDTAYINDKPVNGIFFPTNKTSRYSFSTLIGPVLAKNPDVNVFYFAGVSLYDANEFQNALPSIEKYPNLHVISEDASYVSTSNAQNRWYFTAFAYHDEWSIITQGHQIDPSPFLGFLGPHGNDGEYHKNFDPDSKHIKSPYGFDLPDALTIVSYDGVTALAQAITKQKDPDHITSQGVANDLPYVAFQGVSGYISFSGQSSNGDPVNKTIVMLFAAPKGIQMRCVGGGTFYPGVDQSAHDCSL